MKPRILFGAAVVALISSLALTQLINAPRAAAGVQQDRQEIEKIVREYLLEHPEVIFEAVEVYHAREEEAAAAATAEQARQQLSAMMNASSGHAMGASVEDAEVLVVEFFDYHCGFCRQMVADVYDLAEKKDVRVVLQELPVIHPRSRDVALASLAAGRAGKFKDFHRAVMAESNGVITEEQMAAIASKNGIDFGPIQTMLEDPKTLASLESELEASMALGQSLRVDGTPAFVIASRDGRFLRVVSGARADELKAAIRDARKG